MVETIETTFPNSEMTSVQKALGDFPDGKKDDVCHAQLTIELLDNETGGIHAMRAY